MSNKTSLMKAIRGMSDGSLKEARANALTKETKTHTIDTCFCTDTEQWETGIKPKDSPWVIVEQYEGRIPAMVGHNKWVNAVEENPKLELEDVMEYGF